MYPPCERVRSNKSTRSIPKPPKPVPVEIEDVPLTQILALKTTRTFEDMQEKSALTFEDVQKSAGELETLITSRVDMALSPIEDKVETFLFDAKNHLQKSKSACTSMAVVGDSEHAQMNADATSSGAPLFASFLQSLFNDEHIPVMPVTNVVSEDESSEATPESTVGSHRYRVAPIEREPAKFGVESYTKLVQGLLGDEAVPDPLGPGIPSSIEVSRVVST